MKPTRRLSYRDQPTLSPQVSNAPRNAAHVRPRKRRLARHQLQGASPQPTSREHRAHRSDTDPPAGLDLLEEHAGADEDWHDCR